MTDGRRKSILTMAPAELCRYVKEAAKSDPRRVVTSKHTKWVRMPERGIIHAEIVCVVQTGSMSRQPEPGKAHDELKCRFDGKDFNGKKIGVEISVRDSLPRLFIITVIRYKE